VKTTSYKRQKKVILIVPRETLSWGIYIEDQKRIYTLAERLWEISEWASDAHIRAALGSSNNLVRTHAASEIQRRIEKSREEARLLAVVAEDVEPWIYPPGEGEDLDEDSPEDALEQT